jgi:hypothetical protein
MKLHRKLINTITTISIFASYLVVLPTPAYALDFVLDIDRIYQVTDDKSLLHITERRTVQNISDDYYIPATSTETFTLQNFKEGLEESELEIKKDSIEVSSGSGNSLPFEYKMDGEDIIVTVNYPTAVRTNHSLVFQLEYNTNELLENVGKITNIYIPGFSEDYEEYLTDSDSGTLTRILYSTKLIVPEGLDNPSFTLPEPAKINQNNGTTEYIFDTENIIGKTVWHQLGTSQIYSFKITQEAPKTDFVTPSQLDFISKNQYKIVLPRDYSETNQQVYFTSMDPQPSEIEIDKDGNVIATFLTNATEDEEIVIEGYITVELNGENQSSLNIAETATVDDISQYGDMDKYLETAPYWEVDDEEIQSKAQELKGEQTKILDILQSDYEFIVDSIDYDEFKYGSINQRQGALSTLQGGSSVCMEYSDLLIALARAQGIPARAAYGYGYDPKLQPDEQEDHQWVQAWIPQYGWLTIDPTWGETGRQFIGKDLDHALWYVASENPNDPPPLQVESINSNIDIKSSSIEVIAVTDIPQDSKLKTLNELVSEIQQEDTRISQISRDIQTTMIGKAAIIVVPVSLTVIIITMIVGTIIKRVKNHKTKSVSRKPSTD